MKFVKITYISAEYERTGHIIVPVSNIVSLETADASDAHESIVSICAGDGGLSWFYITMSVDDAFEELKKDYPCLY